MNILQLNCFLAVANSLNFARAAKQMNLSQPAVSHQIKTLEEELNVKLFRRSTRLVEITPEGLSFVTDAQNIVSIAEQARLRFSHPDNTPIQELSIACSSYSGLFLLTGVLHKLSISHANLHPRLHVVPHEQLLHLLETGTADAIFSIYEGGRNRGKLIFQEIFRCPLVCVCRKGYLDSDKKEISIHELQNEKLIFCNPLSLAPEIAQFQWKLAAERPLADTHFCNSPEMSIILAAAGFGLAILPGGLLPPIENIDVISLPESPILSIGLFYHADSENTVLKEFIQETKDQFFTFPDNNENTEKNRIS